MKMGTPWMFAGTTSPGSATWRTNVANIHDMLNSRRFSAARYSSLVYASFGNTANSVISLGSASAVTTDLATSSVSMGISFPPAGKPDALDTEALQNAIPEPPPECVPVTAVRSRSGNPPCDGSPRRVNGQRP
jgi:hypothetical protein